jgi:hypothetical protein
MVQSYSVAAILRTEQRTKSESGYVMIRITLEGRRAELSTKRKVDPERWDSKAGRVKGNKEDAREINNLIETMILNVNRIHRKMIS